MSRGPGRIERTIRALFDAHPDEAFTTDDICERCYGVNWWQVRHKHRVAVVRAAEHVTAVDPDWRAKWSWSRGHTLVYFNAASLMSRAQADVLRGLPDIRRELLPERVRQRLNPPPGWGEMAQARKADLEHKVREHVAFRDADPAERERLLAEREANTPSLAELAAGIRSAMAGIRPQVLSNGHATFSTTHTALAAQARALMTENDPDAIRAGLAEIAETLERLT